MLEEVGTQMSSSLKISKKLFSLWSHYLTRYSTKIRQSPKQQTKEMISTSNPEEK
jgi:hypothetical protein